MVALLFVITSVVSLITFTMGRLFNQDKTAYIHDLTSLIALHTAEETRSQLDGYRERLLVFGGVMYEQDLTQAQKNGLLKRLFEDFQEFVAVTLYVNGVERATVYDAHQLVDRFRPFRHDRAHDLFVTKPGTGFERVAHVQLK